MFKTDKYKIIFERKENLQLHKGKFDTWCYLYDINSLEIPIAKNCAWLNPKDRYDKILGKKIALTKTLDIACLDKVERTEIWIAFWNWVESWDSQSANDRVKNLEKQFPDLGKSNE